MIQRAQEDVHLRGRVFARFDDNEGDGRGAVVLVESNRADIIAAIEQWQRAKDARDKWQIIDSVGRGLGTARLKVPGGWLVRTVGATSSALVFVRDPAHKWEP